MTSHGLGHAGNQAAVKSLCARHRRSRVQTNTLPSRSTGAIDALPHQRLSDTSAPRFRRDSKHPHGGRVRVVHLTQRLEAVDKRHAADDATADIRNKNLTAVSPSGDVTQFPLVELVPSIAERAIRLDGQLASDLVLGRPHRSNDQRRISCHPRNLSGSSGREYGEALLDPRLELEQMMLLLKQQLVAREQPLGLADGVEGLLDQRQVALGPAAVAGGRLGHGCSATEGDIADTTPSSRFGGVSMAPALPCERELRERGDQILDRLHVAEGLLRLRQLLLADDPLAFHRP